jgi:hypothetical protein
MAQKLWNRDWVAALVFGLAFSILALSLLLARDREQRYQRGSGLAKDLRAIPNT